MTGCSRDDRMREALSFYEGLDRLVRDSIGRPWRGEDDHSSPRMDVQEMDDVYALTLSLPGWTSEYIALIIQQNTVTIRGEQKRDVPRDTGTTYHLRERQFTAFRRAFTFPGSVDIDRVEAIFENGELMLRLPKTAATKPRHIPITERSGAEAGLTGQGEPPPSIIEQSTAMDAQDG